jgi:hypothetical protein
MAKSWLQKRGGDDSLAIAGKEAILIAYLHHVNAEFISMPYVYPI